MLHKNTNKLITLESDGTNITLDGDNDLKYGIEDYLSKFYRTLGMTNVSKAAYHTYGKHLIIEDEKGLNSVNTAAFEFLNKFFIPAMTNMGIDCTVTEDE